MISAALNLVLAAGYPSLQDTAMYEVNFRAFSKQGGFRGVTERMDHFVKLNVNTLWLMPIFPVGKVRSAGGLGSPYSVQNYDTVNPEFGTISDFRALVAAAHKRKIKIVLDWVPNHTSWEKRWLANKDWYTQNETGEIQIPAGTNWNDVADLNYDNQEMRAAMIRSMSTWVTKERVDGFRCDVADSVPIDFWKQAITKINKDAGRPVLWLAEGSRHENLTAGFDLNYGWPPYGAVRDLFASKRKPKEWAEIALKNDPPGLRFITNHDEAAWDNSAVTNFGGKDAAFAAFAATSLSNGVPLIYTGQEIGWPDKIPFFDKSEIDWNSGQDQLKRYQKLMTVRASSPALRSGSIQPIPSGSILGFVKQKMSETAIVLVNPTKQPQPIDIPVAYQGKWTSALGTLTKLPPTVTLAPHRVEVLLRR